MGYDFTAWRRDTYPSVSLEFVGEHICIIYFDNPPVNAENWESVVALDNIWRGIREDDGIRCTIITGKDTPYKGKHYFCAGADVKQWSGRDKKMPDIPTPPVRPQIFPRHAFECEASYLASKPFIAMVNGTAVGVGADWAIVADMTIASDDARIGWVYILRGIAPYEGATWLLPRRVPTNIAFELLTTGRIIEAEEAARLGIFNKVVPHEQLREATLEYARWYAEKGPPLAIGATRTLIYTGLNQDYHTHLQMVELAEGNIGPDRIEAMAAWVEKREAKFQYKGAPGK